MQSLPEEKILLAARGIPRGRVAAYKTLARAAGNAHLARFVGFLMSRNRDPLVPCHRVIRSDGSLGGYSFGGKRKKAAMLAREGVKIKNGKVELSVFGYKFR